MYVKGQQVDGVGFEHRSDGQAVELPAIAQLWARARATDLEDRWRMGEGDSESLKREIIRLSIAYSFVTRLTAFVVVDDQQTVVQQGRARRVVQPVHIPAGWHMMDGEATRGDGIYLSALHGPSSPSFSTVRRSEMRAHESVDASGFAEAESELRDAIGMFQIEREEAIVRLIAALKRLIAILEREHQQPELVPVLEHLCKAAEDMLVQRRELISRLELVGRELRAEGRKAPRSTPWRRFWEEV